MPEHVKYCPTCRFVYRDPHFKICIICGSALIELKGLLKEPKPYTYS